VLAREQDTLLLSRRCSAAETKIRDHIRSPLVVAAIVARAVAEEEQRAAAGGRRLWRESVLGGGEGVRIGAWGIKYECRNLQ
jgi:hypothetical protein